MILDMSTEPVGIRVVEATADTKFVDRLREMFPPKYAEVALKEALSDSEMADLRRRYDAAARPLTTAVHVSRARTSMRSSLTSATSFPLDISSRRSHCWASCM
nr:hypothetical protein GCM10020092_094660 [Actinoplanes digitatis]